MLYGLSDDRGRGTIRGPKYGVWYENTAYFQWIGGNIILPDESLNEYYVGSGNNWRPTIVDLQRGLLTLPIQRPVDNIPIPDGAIYCDQGASTLHVRIGGQWKAIKLT